MRIAFIGLGNMGGGMAANLVKAGHEVRAFDLSKDAVAQARDNGCETFTDAAEAVEKIKRPVDLPLHRHYRICGPRGSRGLFFWVVAQDYD